MSFATLFESASLLSTPSFHLPWGPCPVPYTSFAHPPTGRVAVVPLTASLSPSSPSIPTMSTVEAEVTRLYRVRRTVLEMLRDRGYVISDTSTEDLGKTAAEFENNFTASGYSRESLTMFKQRRNNAADQIYVFFPRDVKLGKAAVDEYKRRLMNEGVSRAIIVLQGPMTPSANKAVGEMEPAVRLELFLENELLINITKHVLVPKHEVLGDDEKAALLARYKLKDSQLPRVQKKDAVARYYGLTAGQVMKITRPSETAGRYCTYRLCVG